MGQIGVVVGLQEKLRPRARILPLAQQIFPAPSHKPFLFPTPVSPKAE